MAKKTGLKLAAAALGAAAAAGYYFYASPQAKAHRKITAKWAHDMKTEVIKQGKKIQKVDRKTVEKLVMNAAKTYRGMKNLDAAEVERAARELKANWQEVAKELGAGAKSATKSVKKAVAKGKKTVKKAVKRVSA